MATFADRLKELRKRDKLKQTDLSEFLGMNNRTYQDYEYGLITPSAPLLITLADYYKVSIDYLVGRDFNSSVDPADSVDSNG